jgi:hypothetical protein
LKVAKSASTGVLLKFLRNWKTAEERKKKISQNRSDETTIHSNQLIRAWKRAESGKGYWPEVNTYPE